MNPVRSARQAYLLIRSLYDKLDDLQRAVGRIEMRQMQAADSSDIAENEFKVYSQNGEDGIIQFLLRHVAITRPLFVEFGVWDYLESNTRFLLQNNNWAGLVMDGSEENVERIKSDPVYWRYNLKAVQAFITRENINDLLATNGIAGEIGLLSVDIDGNDYWVWEAIEGVRPAIVVCEYNSLFGPVRQVTTPYSPDFVRDRSHFSNLYYGASIAALAQLGRSKGYALVGSNRAGNNLFFVREALRGQLPAYTPEQAYVRAQFRESRDAAGNLNFLDWEEKLAAVAHLPVYDLESDTLVRIGSL